MVLPEMVSISKTKGRGNTLVLAHESASKFSTIETDYRGNGVVQDLFDEFVKERRGPKTALADHQIEMRFVFPKVLLVSHKFDRQDNIYHISLVYGAGRCRHGGKLSKTSSIKVTATTVDSRSNSKSTIKPVSTAQCCIIEVPGSSLYPASPRK